MAYLLLVFLNFIFYTVPQACNFTAPFNNIRTLKFKAQPTNAFFATVNQMFSGSSQLSTTAEHCFVVWTVLYDLITARTAVVGSWEEPPNIWLTVAKNAFVGWALNFRTRMLLKGAVILTVFKSSYLYWYSMTCFVRSWIFENHNT